MSSCLNARDNICAYIDNELNEEEKLCFEEHIGNCSECRRELEEMTRIIGLCTSIPQQELPTEFKAELHEKLLAVADRQTKNARSIWKKKGFIFTRTIASIAAGVLLIFLAGTFVRYGLSSTKSSSSAPQSADMAMVAEEPAASEAAVQDKKSDAGSGMRSDGAAIAADENFSFSLSVDNSESVEVDRSAMPGDRDASIKMAGMTNVETVNNMMSTVTIIAEEPEELAETVRVLAVGNGGEEIVEMPSLKLTFNEDINSKQEDIYSEQTQESSVGVQSQAQKGLVFTFPQSNYDRFITVLNDALGAANVHMGAFVSEDVTELLNNLIKESEVIDAKLQDLQQKNGNTDSEEINKLKIQKEAADGQIEEMRMGSDLVSVTIYINQK